ncbi:trypsin-like cysteine/serine peptidase domain-containing protein [Podospora australis]|uniref:Trypsin-like cysteine/serine peptidase domain-containing protein n=1 Tax=Podospora australis TaxID=1536484 RepID=A0AAN7AEH9_9PEZI|nr:trypsin-like cysteine/serine peptidase domain-containing protein [Podospora australis]
MDSFSPRQTRLQRKQQQGNNDEPAPKPTGNPPLVPSESDKIITSSPSQDPKESTATIKTLPDRPPISITRLPRKDHKLLLKKQNWLQKYTVSIPLDLNKPASDAVSATLVFAQQEAGTALCIDGSAGLLLTCSHCIAEDEDELDLTKTHWLLFASGTLVSARCVAWDPVRDLSLLQITAASSPPGGSFPAVTPADHPPPVDTKLICVGHPGSEDFEADEEGVATGYDVLHLSTGAFRGYAERQDVQDNSEIGALQHDCWTYWGHSGAPLLDRDTGRLVGLHSSWDDETGMRRGVGIEAVGEFLRRYRRGVGLK